MPAGLPRTAAAAREPSELRGRPAGRSAFPAFRPGPHRAAARCATSHRWSTTARSAEPSAKSAFCSAGGNVVPSRRGRANGSNGSLTGTGAMPPPGPSSIRRRGSAIRARRRAAAWGDGRPLPPRRPHGRWQRWRGPPRAPRKTCDGGQAGLGPADDAPAPDLGRPDDESPRRERRRRAAAGVRPPRARSALPATPQATRRTSVGGGRRS